MQERNRNRACRGNILSKTRLGGVLKTRPVVKDILMAKDFFSYRLRRESVGTAVKEWTQVPSSFYSHVEGREKSNK